MTIQLYQFPISHYSEKVRFALSYKGLDYNIHNLVPGLHRSRAGIPAGGSAVPVISHEGLGIQGSAAIITYLDERFPDRSLTPLDPAQREEALEWERWLDLEVGIAVRCYVYHHIFNDRKTAAPLLATGCNIAERAWMYLGWSRITREIRTAMGINAESAARSLEVMRRALDKLCAHLKKREYIAGSGFSRADLAAAALFAPMFMPEEYGLDFPDPLPPGLASVAQEFKPRLLWAEETYRRFRQPSTGIFEL